MHVVECFKGVDYLCIDGEEMVSRNVSNNYKISHHLRSLVLLHGLLLEWEFFLLFLALTLKWMTFNSVLCVDKKYDTKFTQCTIPCWYDELSILSNNKL